MTAVVVVHGFDEMFCYPIDDMIGVMWSYSFCCEIDVEYVLFARHGSGNETFLHSLAQYGISQELIWVVKHLPWRLAIRLLLITTIQGETILHCAVKNSRDGTMTTTLVCYTMARLPRMGMYDVRIQCHISNMINLSRIY